MASEKQEPPALRLMRGLLGRIKKCGGIQLTAAAATALLLLWALADRIYALGRWPGINGDEAWYGVQLLRGFGGDLSSWRTPSGNLPGPLHLTLLGGLLHLLPQRLWVLRVPTVLSSVAAIVITFVALRRRFNREMGIIGALLQACVPVGIVYARLGWDPSHAPLLGALGLWCALEGRLLFLALLFTFSLLCHPTNVFAGPFLLMAFAASESERRGSREAMRRTGLLVFLFAGSLPVLLATTTGIHSSEMFGDLIKRAGSLSEWTRFIAVLGDFFCGAASFAYTAGPPLVSAGTTAALLLGIWLGAAAAAGARLGAPIGRTGAGLCLGFAATLMTFALVAGAHALEPHFERYGLVLVTPAIAAITVLIHRLSGGRLPGGTGLAVGLLTAAMGLTYTHSGYFNALARTGSLSHPTFWTGDEEPKTAAWRTILQTRPAGMNVRLIADSYWTYVPLAFLARGTPGVTADGSQGPYTLHPHEALYAVGFGDGLLKALRQNPPPGAAIQQWSIPGTGRRELLTVVLLLPK
jgi:hypothetical protein